MTDTNITEIKVDEVTLVPALTEEERKKSLELLDAKTKEESPL